MDQCREFNKKSPMIQGDVPMYLVYLKEKADHDGCCQLAFIGKNGETPDAVPYTNIYHDLSDIPKNAHNVERVEASDILSYSQTPNWKYGRFGANLQCKR